MNAAVILMAYGSPATAEDVPAYLADIREGRPVSHGYVSSVASWETLPDDGLERNG